MVVLEWMPKVVFAFLLTVIWIKLLESHACRIGLVDKPSGRKHHEGAVPLIGGLAICASFLFSVLFLDVSLQHYHGLFAAMALLVAMGIGDDLHDLPAIRRLLTQIVAAALIITISDLKLRGLGDLTGLGNIGLGIWSAPFTIFCVVGVINGLNMVDGLDGLAGGIAFVAIFWLTVLVVPLVGWSGLDAKIMLLLLGAIAGFLFFNLRHPWRRCASVFMGDAGSMVLGLILAWFMIDFTQREEQIFVPIIAVWILGLPVLDTLSVMIRRILSGNSPFHGDRGHIHHILLSYGRSDVQTVYILLVFSTLLGGIGVAAWYLGVPEHVLFYGFVMLGGLYFCGSFYALRGLKKVSLLQRSPGIGRS